MKPAKIFILYRKNQSDNPSYNAYEDQAKKIKKATVNAALMINKNIDIELTTNESEFRDFDIRREDLPVLIIDNKVVFRKHIPPVEFIKQILAGPQDQQKYF